MFTETDTLQDVRTESKILDELDHYDTLLSQATASEFGVAIAIPGFQIIGNICANGLRTLDLLNDSLSEYCVIKAPTIFQDGKLIEQGSDVTIAKSKIVLAAINNSGHEAPAKRMNCRRDRLKYRAVCFAKRLVIRGNIHADGKIDPKGFLGKDQSQFFAMQTATVSHFLGPETQMEFNVAIVNRSHVSMMTNAKRN